MDDSVKLLSCPECGKRPKISIVSDEMKYFCGVHVPCGDWKHTEKEAADDWNRRAAVKDKCWQCDEELKEVYQIKVIDESGKRSFEKVCSMECATEVQQELYGLHKNRADEIMSTSIQRLK